MCFNLLKERSREVRLMRSSSPRICAIRLSYRSRSVRVDARQERSSIVLIVF